MGLIGDALNAVIVLVGPRASQTKSGPYDVFISSGRKLSHLQFTGNAPFGKQEQNQDAFIPTSCSVRPIENHVHRQNGTQISADESMQGTDRCQ